MTLQTLALRGILLFLVLGTAPSVVLGDGPGKKNPSTQTVVARYGNITIRCDREQYCWCVEPATTRRAFGILPGNTKHRQTYRCLTPADYGVAPSIPKAHHWHRPWHHSR